LKISIENVNTDVEEEIIIRCYEVNDEILELMNKLKTKNSILVGYNDDSIYR